MALALACVLLLAPSGATAGPRGARRGIIRLTGYLGDPPDGRTEEADLTLRWGDADHRFQVTKATLVSGDGLAAQVLEAVRPYNPNFILRGPSELLAKLDHLAPHQSVTFTGQFNRGDRNLLVGSVEPAKSK